MVKKGRVRSSVKQAKGQTSPGRRRFLKTAAVTAGAAASSGLIDGFPLVWSQNIKDITLVHVGGSYSAIIDIAKKATEDLGFTAQIGLREGLQRLIAWRSAHKSEVESRRQLSGVEA